VVFVDTCEVKANNRSDSILKAGLEHELNRH